VDKLKVVFLIAGFEGGGAQKQSIFLLNELQKDESFEIHLIYFYEGVNFDLLDQSNLHLHKVQTGSFYDVRNIFKISKILKFVKPEILMSWLHASDVYSFALKLLNRNIKWIMTERDSFYPFDLRYKLRAFAGKRADLIIANSLKGQEYWVKMGFPFEKTKVVTNILLEPNLPEKSKSKEPTILYVGRLEPQKNVINLTKYFIELSSIFPEGKFYIIGEGTLKVEIENLIKVNNKKTSIQILPFQKNVSNYFLLADIFVNISKHEGTPNTVIENIQLGNFVLASNIPEHVDLLGEEYPFLLNKLDDKEEFIKLIVKILESKTNPEDYLIFAKQKLKSMAAEIVADNYKLLFKNLQHDKKTSY
jgi:glycosyltransferase involved in cell wall biosynthesis